MCRDRSDELVCAFLVHVWWRVRCHLGLPIDKVAGETPDFFLAVETVEDEISVFIFAMGIGTNVILECIVIIGWYSLQGGGGVIILLGGDSIGGHQRRGGSRKDHLKCAS